MLIKEQWSQFASKMEAIDLSSHKWSGVRRFTVQKADYSFRSVCQFDPIDSLLFTAMMREIGPKIEKRRIDQSRKILFSNRFKPKASGQMYEYQHGWRDFWMQSDTLNQSFSHVFKTDISDFYNQIYHHTIENQLIECKCTKAQIAVIKSFLANSTDGVSRGVPVGPHSTHILAELALVPLDNFMLSKGYKFCRYADDIHVFCSGYTEAQKAMLSIVQYLDKTQKMNTNRSKTEILRAEEFAEICALKMEDSPINDIERRLLSTISKAVTNPYRRVVSPSKISVDRAVLTRANIENVLSAYTSQDDIDYTRLRWFIRRLSQVGAPGGVDYIISHFDFFLPAIAELATYFESSKSRYKGKWNEVGQKLLYMFDNEVVQASEYMRLVLISFFSSVKKLNNINQITKRYDDEQPPCQREIVLAAERARETDWIRGLKDQYKNSDPWLRRAIIYACKQLPPDEREFWRKAVKRHASDLEELILKAE